MAYNIKLEDLQLQLVINTGWPKKWHNALVHLNFIKY